MKRVLSPETVAACNESTNPDGADGFYAFRRGASVLRVIVSDGEDPVCDGWEHVSVSLHNRTPTWDEMCFIKDQFWLPEETVIQFHPAESEYKRVHPYVLHLWRHKSGHALPPRILV